MPATSHLKLSKTGSGVFLTVNAREGTAGARNVSNSKFEVVCTVNVKPNRARKKPQKTHKLVSTSDAAVDRLMVLMLAANAEFLERLENLERTYAGISRLMKQSKRTKGAKHGSKGSIASKTPTRTREKRFKSQL
jgi:hypothetical protein